MLTTTKSTNFILSANTFLRLNEIRSVLFSFFSLLNLKVHALYKLFTEQNGRDALVRMTSIWTRDENEIGKRVNEKIISCRLLGASMFVTFFAVGSFNLQFRKNVFILSIRCCSKNRTRIEALTRFSFHRIKWEKTQSFDICASLFDAGGRHCHWQNEWAEKLAAVENYRFTFIIMIHYRLTESFIIRKANAKKSKDNMTKFLIGMQKYNSQFMRGSNSQNHERHRVVKKRWRMPLLH